MEGMDGIRQNVNKVVGTTMWIGISISESYYTLDENTRYGQDQQVGCYSMYQTGSIAEVVMTTIPAGACSTLNLAARVT